MKNPSKPPKGKIRTSPLCLLPENRNRFCLSQIVIRGKQKPITPTSFPHLLQVYKDGKNMEQTRSRHGAGIELIRNGYNRDILPATTSHSGNVAIWQYGNELCNTAQMDAKITRKLCETHKIFIFAKGINLQFTMKSIYFYFKL